VSSPISFSVRIIFAAFACGLILSPSRAKSQEADYRLYDEIAVERKIVGPFIGHVTDSTANIWVYAGPRSTPLVLEIEKSASEIGNKEDEAPRQREETAPNSQEHHAVKFHVDNLEPHTRYVFKISLADDPVAAVRGSFATAPESGKPAKFRMAVSSCFGGAYRRENGRTREVRGEYHNDSWQLLMDLHPDLQLIIGDNVYADSTDYNHLWDSYTLERINNRPFGEAIRMMPTYAVWDDHDYGPNNSDGTAPGKEQSLRAFGEVYVNPPRTGDGGPGIYTNFSWGGVDFFLLDGRYNRTPNVAPNDDKKRYLGDEQFEWLVARLKESKAPFKVLVNGSTWGAKLREDSWNSFNFERIRLWEAIVANNISGIVFASGDIHRCDLPLHWPEVKGGYPMPEIISSGLGSHGKYDPLGFVIADFDLTVEDPLMTARVIDGEGVETVIRRVRASELQVRRGDDH
jgi:alkaline phosphatase D